MKHNCSNNCSSCKNLKKKLDMYENFVKDMQKLEIIEERNNSHYNPLEESVIIEKDNSGNQVKKIRSDLSESFMVVEKGKNMQELNKKERDIIKEQDAYSNYQNTNAHFKKANGAYKAAYYVLSVGKWLLLL